MNPIKASGSINQSWQYRTTSSYDEDLTRYEILPTDLYNRAPTIKRGLTVIHVQGKTYTEHIPDDTGTIKVLKGETICFKVEVNNTKIHIENGVLTEVQLDDNDLVPITYNWMLDGELIVDDDRFTIKNEYLQSYLYLDNIEISHAGLYDCQISNEFGGVVSHPITIEVVDYEEEDLILKNIITNGCAKDNEEGWNVSAGSPIFQEISKEIYSDSFEGYAISMFPSSRITSGIYSFGNVPSIYDEIIGSNKFFSRNIQYIEEGGSENTILYQDIDITDLSDYLNNNIIGIRGLGAKFICFIGNSISYYKFRYNSNTDTIYDETFFTGSNRFTPDNMEHYTIQVDEFVSCKVQLLGNQDVLLERMVSDPFEVVEYPMDRNMQILMMNKFRASLGAYGQTIEKKTISFEEIPSNTTAIRIIITFRHRGLILHAKDNILDPNPQYQGSIWAYIQGTQFPSIHNVEEIEEIYEGDQRVRGAMSPFSNGDPSNKYMNFINQSNQMRELMKTDGTNRPMPKYGCSRAFVTGLNFYICPWDGVGTSKEIIPNWSPQEQCSVGNRRRYNNHSYEAIHNPTKGMAPTDEPNIWMKLPDNDYHYNIYVDYLFNEDGRIIGEVPQQNEVDQMKII